MTAHGRVSESQAGADQEYLAKAQEFAASMDDAMAGEMWTSAALLGVHAAIAAADAVCSRELKRHSSSKRHEDAVELLETVKLPGVRDRAALLSQVLGAKHAAAYEARPFGAQDARTLAKRVHRFLEWAEAIIAR